MSPLLMMDGGVTATRQLVAACSSLASPAVLAAAVLLALQSSNQLLTCSEQKRNIFSARPQLGWIPGDLWWRPQSRLEGWPRQQTVSGIDCEVRNGGIVG